MPYSEAPQPSEYNEFYGKYVARVLEGDIVAILATQVEDTLAILRDLNDAQALRAYAAGKWTIKQVIGHIIDAERVFAYRMMRFARGDETPLATFDENHYAAAGDFNDRPLATLTAELRAVRAATVALLAHLPREAWMRGGQASIAYVSVRALAWITAGHELHHRAILAERYLGASATGPSAA